MTSQAQSKTQNNAANDAIQSALAQIKGGSTLGMLKGIKNEDLEALYGVAHTFYTQHEYERAEKLFAYLCMYSHLDKRFWKGLGASRQMQKKYRKAAEAYAYMALLDVEDPEPSFHAAFCFIELKDKKSAKKSLDAAIAQAEGKKSHAALRKQAVTMLAQLDK